MFIVVLMILVMSYSDYWRPPRHPKRCQGGGKRELSSTELSLPEEATVAGLRRIAWVSHNYSCRGPSTVYIEFERPGHTDGATASVLRQMVPASKLQMEGGPLDRLAGKNTFWK